MEGASLNVEGGQFTACFYSDVTEVMDCGMSVLDSPVNTPTNNPQLVPRSSIFPQL